MNNRKIAGVFVFFLSMLLSIPAAVLADFNSGSTGADGALAPPSSPNSYIVPAQGHDDGVYNFTTVTIPAGVTVTFQKNANNTPITIKASGDVMINGTISVSGGDGSLYQSVGIGGPGGFDGGIGGWFNSNGRRGLGPGGGDATSSNGKGGTFAYGNDGQLPMIGGSGGSGGAGNGSYNGGSGGGGGGAILIASSGTITVNGSITANGGNGGSTTCNSWWYGCVGWTAPGGGGGSGGAIRLVATTIAGNGTISANAGGGGGGIGREYGGSGAVGRVRFEAWNFTRTAQTSPALTANTQKWNPTAIAPAVQPSLNIISIGGVSAPAIPKGDSRTPDIQLPANITNPVSVVVTATNIPAGTSVTVKSLSSIGSTVDTKTAILDSTSTAAVDINLAVGFPTVLAVSATYTAVASNGSPLYAEGERVEKVRVDTAMGGSSTITYITASGREISQKQS